MQEAWYSCPTSTGADKMMSGVRQTRRYLRGMKGQNWGRGVFVSGESAVQIPVGPAGFAPGALRPLLFGDRPFVPLDRPLVREGLIPPLPLLGQFPQPVVERRLLLVAGLHP